MPPPRTIDDLSEVSVLGMTHREASQNGYIEFRQHGVVNHTEGVRDGKCWLLLPERVCLWGNLESLEVVSRTASLRTPEKEEPKARGRTFPYLDGYWQAYQIWMVTESLWEWKKVTFLASDAIAESLPSDGSTLHGTLSKDGYI